MNRKDGKQKVCRKASCRICSKPFTANSNNASTCVSCLDAKPLCACGCGEKVSSLREVWGREPNKFVAGHGSRLMLESTKKKISAIVTSLSRNIKVRKRLSKQAFVRWSSQDYVQKQLIARNTPAYKKIQGERFQRIWASLSKRELKARLDWLEEMRRRCRRTPNAPEKALDKILQKTFPGQFHLNVKGKVVIDGKIPDFVGVNKKKLIEMFGTFWHGEQVTGRTKKKEEAHKISRFKKFGYQTTIVWQDELKDTETLVKRLKSEIQ